jgi:hypothetical protein
MVISYVYLYSFKTEPLEAECYIWNDSLKSTELNRDISGQISCGILVTSLSKA